MRSFLLMTVVSAAALLAQQPGTGSLTGKILDPDGVPARGLPVQAVNLATRAAYKATVSTQGEFSIAQLPAGTYQFSTLVLANRMLPYVQDDLKIAPGQTVKLEIRMQEGITLNTLGDGRDYFREVAAATRMVAPKGETPRMLDGKPDFSGYWTGAGGSSDLGAPDFQDWAEALSKERYANDLRDMPSTRCQPNGVVRTIFQGNAQRFLETQGLLVMYAEGHLPRQIYLDGRSHPKDPNPAWLGHSIGRWEGDTLVVDSVGFNNRPWVDSSHSLTEKLHLVERYRRPDLGHLELEMTAEDVGALKSPWMIKRTYVLDLNDDIMESVCTENEKDAQHILPK
jgi:hypothetical protein